MAHRDDDEDARNSSMTFGTQATSIRVTDKEACMRTVMVRYKVKPDRVAENKTYIEKVFEELDREGPTGFRYASFVLGDGVSFVHIVFEESSEGASLAGIPAFQAFTADIADRCDEPPVATGMTPVGTYRLLDS
jgi:hypothetical protein